jgi:glycosyltransferase involved in cell wall biosynthesis
LRTVASRTFVVGPAALRATLAWKVYARLPRRLQALAAGARLWVRRLRGYTHHLGSFLTPSDIRFVRRAVLAEKPAIVVYDGVFNVCGELGEAQQWVITHEVKHQRVGSFAAQQVAVRPAHFDADLETSILSSVGNIIAIHWDDAREFGRMMPRARTVVVPVSLDIPAPVESAQRVFGQCLFVGSGSFHNVDGLRWFLDACWPALKAAIPAATLEVYGTVCQRLAGAPSGVVLRGTVDDLATAYSRASLALVPLRIGSGLKVKLVEALAHGMPVVTTPIGAQGLLGFRPQPFVCADSAEAFASRCSEVLRSPEQRATLARAARTCAELFAPEAAFADFDAALHPKRAAL